MTQETLSALVMSRAASNNVRGPSSALTEFLRVRGPVPCVLIEFTWHRKLELLLRQLRVAPQRGYRMVKNKNLQPDPVDFRITIIGMVKDLRLERKPLGVPGGHQGGGVETQVSYSGPT